jgi:hypothetical protein
MVLIQLGSLLRYTIITDPRHRQYWAQDTERKHTKQRRENPETQAILGTRHRTKTYKTKNGESRDTGNIGNKAQNEDIQNKEWRIQRHRQY